MLYNYCYWGYNERRRRDGPPRGQSQSCNSTPDGDIDDVIRQVIQCRVSDAFADRPDDVSGADDAPHYAMVRQSGDLGCRGEDRLEVSCNYLNIESVF